MKQENYFGKAKWVGCVDRTVKSFSILRGYFQVNSIKNVTLNVLGLGFFKCYINGTCINPDTFLPLSSDYEGSCDPKDEVLSGHRIYVPNFDITQYVKLGKNVIAIHFGGGWYTHNLRSFGLPKAIYNILVEEDDEVVEFVSDDSCRISNGYIDDYNFVKYEHQNYANFIPCFNIDFDDNLWAKAIITENINTEYCQTECSCDALIKELPIKEIGKGLYGVIYDCGQNTTGYPVLELNEEKGSVVRVLFSEELLENRTLDLSHAHGQEFIVKSDGTNCIVQPEFTWFGFRYFEIVGKAKPKCVKEIHANIPITSDFNCDNDTLNWIYKTFIHTMLCNMHSGLPSDCPHIERQGYTGDGQLTCHAVLSAMGAEAFYRKWLQDIADGQDVLSGHIQYVAPYIKSGGGPGGWGCAIIEVPYQLYKHFGDKDILSKYYANMKRYIDYLEAHSEYGLVTSDKDIEWCLGDWCTPNILYIDKGLGDEDQQFIIPPPMVNTYFMVKSLNRMCEIAKAIGFEEDVEMYEKKAEYRKNAIRAAYFNTRDGNFIMNIHGANAFAVDLGIGDERTYYNMVNYYKKLGCFDTGIFATDILTRILFERGDGDLAVELLTNNGAQGFEHWRQKGATTFHEYWDSNKSRSHNHPMFGAPVAYFFEYLLGIKQKSGTSGYVSLIIEPQIISKLRKITGKMNVLYGILSVDYEINKEHLCARIVIPKNINAVFKYKSQEYRLIEGKNELHISIE